MEEPYEGENTNPEVIEDLYVLKTKIDTSDIAKLRRELQQVRYELAQAQTDVRRLRTSSEGSFSQVGGVNATSQLKMELDRVKELKYQQSQLLGQINTGSIRDTQVFTRALSSLNNELESIGSNSRALEAAVTIMEGAMGRMAAVSKKSQDYKQLQESFSSFGIEAKVSGSGGRTSLAQYIEEAERINNTPVSIKINDQELTATIDQLEIIETLLTRIASQTKQNIVLSKTYNNQTISSVITPSAGGSQLSSHAYVPPSFFVERAQSVSRDGAGFTQPSRAVMAAFHGTPLLSLDTNQQIRSSTSPTQSRGTSKEDVRELLTEAGLIKQLPARNQFMTMGTSSFLDVSHIDKLSGVMDRVVTKIDSVILADIRYLGDRYGQRKQLSNRSQMSGVIDGILSDDAIGEMERAYHYQVSKLVSLFNVDWKDTGGQQYWKRGTPSANITDKEFAILDLVDQFPGSLKSSEISHALEMGHYQSLNSPVRDLQSKGLLRRAIVPPVPIPEAGINNQIHPAIMSLLATDPSLFMQFAMEASPIKFLDTSDRGRQVLEMMGGYNNPSRVNTGMQLNAMVSNSEDTLVDNYKSQMALPPANAWWLRGYNMLNYGDSASGSKLLHHLEGMLNNQAAYNPELMKSILPFIPHSKDAQTGRISVNPEGWIGKDSQYQLHPTNAGQYLGARSDINWALRTPYMFIDKLMESVARPNRDLFSKNMLGTEAYLRSTVNWASGPQGRGLNPQLERYTITPEQATQYFKILFGSLKLDTSLTKSSDKFQEMYGRQYTPYTQYEKSIIIRASNEMLKRALPVSSGQDVGTLELLRNRSFMSKGEGAQVDKMMYSARQEEFSQLIRSVPDLHRYFRAFEAYQKEVLGTFSRNTADLAGIFEENADTLGTSKPVPPEMRRRIANDQNAPSSWKKYPEFYGSGFGQTYEEIYTTKEGMSSDPSVARVAMSRLNAQSEKSSLRTVMPAPYINKFRTDTGRSDLKGFTGVLPWNAVLDHYSQYGSQDLNPAGQKEYERLMSNPAELMKEIMWDYTYVEGENTKNPQIKNVIMDTYGTVMKKHAMFGWVNELKDPGAIKGLQDINEKYTGLLAPERIDGLVAAYIKENGTQGMSQDMIRNRITQPIERQSGDEVLDWADKNQIEMERTGNISNVFKMRPDNTVSAFYEYLPEKVPSEDVIKRMQYDMQKGRMDPGLLEKYARAVASQKTREGTGHSFHTGIESMYRNASWDYEGMENLPQLLENQVLFGYARTGTEGTFDFAGKGHQAGADWSNSAIQDALGIDTSLIDDDTLHDMINTNMEFRGSVKQTVMEAMGVGSDKEWDQYIQYASQQVRQRLKRWEHISMSLKPGIDEFNENFMNGFPQNETSFREPYDFGEVQTDFGNITDISFLDYVKRQYYERQPATPPKGAMTRGINDAQYGQLIGSSGKKRSDWERSEQERLQAWGVLQELPSSSSAGLFHSGDVRQSMYSYSPDWDWDPMKADTGSITYNRGFTMRDSVSPADEMLGGAKSKFGVSPFYTPRVNMVGSTPNGAPGNYILGKNMIEISKSAKDPASVMYHEYMHSVGSERLARGDSLSKMVDFYQGNSIPMFKHSEAVGESLKNVKFDDVFKGNYLSGLKRKDPAAYAQELARIAPFRKLFQNMSTDGVKNFYAMGEEIAIVMEKYHQDYGTHVQNLFGSTATDAQKMKVAYARNIVGIETAFPDVVKGLPVASAETQRRFGSKTQLGIGDTLPFVPGVGGQSAVGGFNPKTGMPAGWFEGRQEMPWHDRMISNFVWNKNAKERTWMSSLPDASITQPGKLVRGRGEEVPFTYQLTGSKEEEIGDIYKKYAALKEWMGTQGYDTSRIKDDVISQYGSDGALNVQGMMSGMLRIPDSMRRGRKTNDIIGEVAKQTEGGYRSFNDQASRYEDTMDKMPKWTDAFTKHGKAIAGVSWQFTTLQMAALGIFFSMMSLVSVMGQGIGMIVGGVGDLEGMMKAKAMAGMSGNFYDTKTNQTFSGTYIDDQLGINDQTRVDAWKNLTDFSSTLSTMLSGFGAKVLTSPKFLDASNIFLNKLFDVLKDDKNLESVVNLSQTLFETLGNIVEKLPGLIQLFDKIALLKVPEGVPFMGGQSALSVYGTAALVSLIAMPILAGVTLLTKLVGWAGEGAGILGGLRDWNKGRVIEQKALKLGYSADEAASFRKAGGLPKTSGADEAFFARTGKASQTTLDDFAKVGDDIAKSGFKLSNVLDDIAKRLGPVIARLPKPVAAVAGVGAIVAGAANVVEDTTRASTSWRWGGKGVSTAIGLAPAVVGLTVPGATPVTDPMGNAMMFTGPAMRAGMGSFASAAVTAPAAVVMSATPVGGPDISTVGDRTIEKVRNPFMGILDLPGLTTNSYYDTSTGEQLKDFTDYDWGMSKKQANGISSDPLSSKWTKDSGATFNQTNTFNTTVPVDEIGQILDYVRGIARQVGV